ncbi:MAG: monovalent cation:proton antiporter-2 (CPA2) family protein [Rhodocyclaceae bacterium]|nr:monovalent cation:proton antiporter-2 (CPA2) family protein [Rhodocyclaceae bacterium]MCP5239338.1 cation:proton antiporter [Zoogloeaceae bacterium]MCP5254894.1 cation:proton antiporter [Zoogloeaceae bacterium]MCP5295602.1 cation:proton antiporter [Zoogloeaceae bacterium]MCW5616318.1 monovalent cation:proton antiporter-2 (CPA2) family protein [Rhodocyclaceae bacterium]
MLILIALLLLASVVMIPLARRAGLGAVLGYLMAGVAIGPWGLALITDADAILHFAEFGVILLLFVIGLELKPARLWELRKPVFGLGGAQVLLSALAIGAIAMLLGQPWRLAMVIGFALALSSTAMVLQTLAERHQLTDRHGRDGLAVLLFQDIAVIPMLAILPLLAGSSGSVGVGPFLTAVAAILGLVVLGRKVLHPLFGWIATLGNRETFTAAALLVVVGATLLMEAVGLSASLGAFLAGVVLADSQYRHELEADLEPFKGLLLGLFFMAVGMEANLGLLLEQPLRLLAITGGLLLVKFVALLVIGAIAGRSASSTRKLALSLAQGGEFAFVIFQLARQQALMPSALSDLLTLAVTLSMLAWPLLVMLDDKLVSRMLDHQPAPPFDPIAETDNPVVIAGYGRVGQIVARVLTVKRIPFTVLEADPQQVDYVRRFGNEVYFGDASRLDLLHAAGVEKAKVFVLAIDDVEASLRTAELVHRHFPGVEIHARARNRMHAYRLMDLGVSKILRETWHSSVAMSEAVLIDLGFTAEHARRTAQRFAEHDEETLRKQYAIYDDETQFAQSVQQARAELRNLFEQDTAVKDRD